MADTLSFIPETPASMSDHLATTPTPTSSSAKKLALAEHRYGREEMLSLFQENPPLPSRIARIPDLVRTEATQPLALIPLTDQEQYALAGAVNSHSVYGMRGGAGRGFYPQRGGGGGAAGRGRRPRQDPYWPTTPDEPPARGTVPSSLGAGGTGGAYFQRQSSDPYRGVEGRPDGPGSRASRDTNWRFSSSSATTPTGSVGEGEDGSGWGKHWHPSATSPVKPVGGRWREGSGWKERWQALPEWATDESTGDGGGKEKGKGDRTGSAVGSFDTSGNFTMNERENDEKEEEPPDQFPEDVFEEEPVADEKDSSYVSKQEQRPSSPPEQQSVDKGTTTGRVAGSSVASSGDSMEEMARRFEKAAEAVLSTDEETPSPRPNLSSQFFPSTHEQKQHQPPPQQQHKQKHGKQQHNQKQPKQPHQAEKQQLDKNALPSVDMTSWVYCDPQGDMQGPFSNQEMHDWFRAGYFTMDLMVRRLCDVVMLPLGQVITAWGRVPFAPGPAMPAMQSTDPYLRQLLQQPLQKQPQVKLAQPDSHHKESAKALSSGSAAPTPSDPIANSQSPASLLWGLAPEPPTDNEEQWPELFSSEKHSSTPHQSVAMVLTERRDEEENRNEKERKRLKDQTQVEEEKRKQEQLEEERKRKEDKRKQEEKNLAEERKRHEMELKKQRQAEIQQREEEEKRLLEQERKKIEEEIRVAEEKRREAELLRQQREYEEAQRRAEEEERRREEMQLAMSPHHRGWNTVEHDPPSPQPVLHQQQQPTPSLLQIQREEQIIAEKERRQMEEVRMFQQHQQNVPIGGGWASMAAGSRPTSFLDIQKEQQGVGGHRRPTKNNAPAATPPAHQSFSWSKAACTNKQQPVAPLSHQPKQQQPPQRKPTTAVVEQNKAVAAFWEEAAMESDAAYNAKSTVGSKEEERVRKLFTTSPDEVLTNWCASELAKFDVDVDPATFVSLLLEVESTYEVHDYIRSFLGETDEVHAFAKQFLDNRQKLKKNQQKKTHQRKAQSAAATTAAATAVPFVKGGTVNSSVVVDGAGGSSSARAAKKKNKKKMQKVHPSAMLGFTVNAAERPNAGEIQSAKDAV